MLPVSTIEHSAVREVATLDVADSKSVLRTDVEWEKNLER
jgi:hypothetical protein